MRFALALLLPCVAAAGPLDPYSDADAGFSVMFPQPPDRSEHDLIVHGVPRLTHLYTVELGAVNYAVSYSDHPEAASNMPELTLQGARDSVVQGGTVKKETTGKLDGFPTRRVTFEKDGARVSFQLVLRGTRLFQAMVVRPAGDAHDTAAATFLDSFALTATAATRPKPPAPRPPAPARALDGGSSR